MSVVGELDAALKAAGLEFDGVSLPSMRIDWRAPPSKEDLQKAQAVIDGFDMEATEAILEKRRQIAAANQALAVDGIAIIAKALIDKGQLVKGDLPPDFVAKLDAQEAADSVAVVKP